MGGKICATSGGIGIIGRQVRQLVCHDRFTGAGYCPVANRKVLVMKFSNDRAYGFLVNSPFAGFVRV